MLARLTWWFCAVVAVVVSLKSLREPDLWWMFRTGEWIVEHKSIPYQDVFSFTQEGVDWINVKWLFEVLLVFVKTIGGAESVFLLQAGVAVSIVFWWRGVSRSLPTATDSQVLDIAGALVALAALMTLDFRLIGRPEMVSHCLTAAYLYIFARYRRTQSVRTLYPLIPLQCLWANLHEGFGTGMILLAAWAAGEVVQTLALRKTQTNPAANLSKQLLIVVIAILSVAIHPQGVTMWLHPYNIYQQLSDNQYTTELASYTHWSYWQWEAYLNIGFSIVSLLGIGVLLRQQSGTWLARIATGFPPSAAVLYVALFYLSLTAYRNIPFFILVSVPYATVAVAAAAEWLVRRRVSVSALSGLVCVLAVGAYASIVTGTYREFRKSSDEYGLQVLSSHNPMGAAQFIQAQGLAGSRCYSDYLTSSYLLWRLQPDFKTYIDLRDLDVFSPEFFQTFAQTTYFYEAFAKQDSQYNFRYAVVYRPQFTNLHRSLLSSEQYDLVFVDAVAAVYCKNIPDNAAIIQRFGFKANGRKDIFSALPPCESGMVAGLISRVFYPLFSVEDYKSISQDAIAGSFWQTLGEYNLAMERGKMATMHPTDGWRGHELLGNIYNTQLGMEKIPQNQQNLITQATAEYDKALKKNPKTVSALIGKGLLYMQQGQYSNALPYLRRALDEDNYNFDANKYMAYAHKFLYFGQGRGKVDLEQWLKYSLVMDKLNPDNPFILLDLGLAHCNLNNCAESVAYLEKIQQFPNFSADEQKALQECLAKCKR